MPWKETSVMDQRVQLIADWLSGDSTTILGQNSLGTGIEQILVTSANHHRTSNSF